MAFRSPLTPRRIYYNSNICVLCGFAFVQSEVTSTGEKIDKKFFNKKLKLTDQRIKAVTAIVDGFDFHDELHTKRRF